MKRFIFSLLMLFGFVSSVSADSRPLSTDEMLAALDRGLEEFSKVYGSSTAESISGYQAQKQGNGAEVQIHYRVNQVKKTAVFGCAYESGASITCRIKQ